MKKLVQSSLILGVLALLGGSPLVAQAGGAARFHLGGGAVLPQGRFDDGFKVGWQAGGGIGFEMTGAPVVLRLDGFYGRSTGDQAQVGNDVKQIFIGALIGGEYSLTGRGSSVRPYVIGQFGLANVKLHVGPLEDSQTKFTFAGGLGLEFGAGGFRLFSEAKYQQVQTIDTSTAMIPVLVGLRFGGF